MNSPRVEEEQALSIQLAAVLDPAISSPVPSHQIHKLLREIEDHLRLVSENAQDGEATLRLLAQRMPSILEESWQAHEELARRVAGLTAELSQANTLLKKQITEIAQ